MLSCAMPVPESATAMRTPDGVLAELYVQHSFPVGHGTHRLDGIHDQVSKDQLQLNSVAHDGREDR